MSEQQSSSSSPPQKCHLLRLPRELRDTIYNYALVHPEGLFFHRESPYKAYFYIHEKQSRSHASLIRKDTEINQLKYVCRQMRRETLGLELQINCLIFESSSGDTTYSEGVKNGVMQCIFRFTPKERSTSAAVSFLGFLDMCSEAWRCRLRRVRLAPGTLDQEQSLLDLHLIMYWCQLHPQTTVSLELPYIRGTHDPEFFLALGLKFTDNLKRNMKVHKLIQELELHSAWGDVSRYRTSTYQTWRAGVSQARVLTIGWRKGPGVEADNFRVVPADGPFDEGAFRGEMKHSRRRHSHPLGEDIADKRVEWARAWYTQGI